MTPLHAVLLGLVQGVAEWLPVSSSGHLVLLQEFLGLEVPIFFDLVLHVATALVVIMVFRKDVLDIFRSLARTFRLRRRGLSFREIALSEKSSVLAWFILLGSIPIAILGFAFHDSIRLLFSDLTTVGAGLLVTGILLAFTVLSKRRKEFMRNSDALSIGIAQGISLIPGLSRSGFTISVGMLRGIDRELAARYSFLLSVPAVLGAAAFELIEVISGQISVDLVLLAVAFFSSIVFGYLSIKTLWYIVKNARLHYFSVYCIVVGFAILTYVFFA